MGDVVNLMPLFLVPSLGWVCLKGRVNFFQSDSMWHWTHDHWVGRGVCYWEHWHLFKLFQLITDVLHKRLYGDISDVWQHQGHIFVTTDEGRKLFTFDCKPLNRHRVSSNTECCDFVDNVESLQVEQYYLRSKTEYCHFLDRMLKIVRENSTMYHEVSSTRENSTMYHEVSSKTECFCHVVERILSVFKENSTMLGVKLSDSVM